MILLDANMLVSAHRADADQHREIKSWLEGALSDPAGVGISELALSGCLRVITHPKVFKKPTPLAQAIDFVEDFRSRDEVHLLRPGAGHWKIFVDLCRRSDARQSCAGCVPRRAGNRAWLRMVNARSRVCAIPRPQVAASIGLSFAGRREMTPGVSAGSRNGHASGVRSPNPERKKED